MKYLIYSLLLAISFSVSADSPCDEKTDNAVDWRTCIKQLHQTELTKTYNELLKAVTPNKEVKDSLIKSQRAWITYRNESCGYITLIHSLDDEAVCIDHYNIKRIQILNQYKLSLEDFPN